MILEVFIIVSIFCFFELNGKGMIWVLEEIGCVENFAINVLKDI